MNVYSEIERLLPVPAKKLGAVGDWAAQGMSKSQFLLKVLKNEHPVRGLFPEDWLSEPKEFIPAEPDEG